MELRKEYAEIVNLEYNRWTDCAMETLEVCKNIALACQALADRPMKELTDAEIDAAYCQGAQIPLGEYGPEFILGVRHVIAAFLKKQSEPETVKFRAARHKLTGRIQMFRKSDSVAHADDSWEWLEPAQEFEVRI